MELVIKRCLKCGATVEVLHDCTCDNCGIKCCGEEMKVDKPNSVDASFEKHVPQIERVEDEIFVKVMHPMEKEHYIMWIAQVTENKTTRVRLYPEQATETRFPYIKGATLYAYCNKHGLWKTVIE